MMTYTFLQHYWYFLVCLLAGLLVFLMFVQGANSLIFSLGRTEEERELVVNSTGRKWEYTFTTLVTFGGAFFASFPLFYSTSFGGAYWVWMLILASFVLQAVAYEYQSKPGNVFGKTTYRWFLVLNGFFGPFLVGAAVATFFTGSAFIVSKGAIGGMEAAGPVISRWANGWHGLDALANPWNWVMGFAVFFLARTLGLLYVMNNVADECLRSRISIRLIGTASLFLLFFLAFLGHVLVKDGFAVDADGIVSIVPYKYLHNLQSMWYVAVALVVGVSLVLYGIVRTIWSKAYTRGIWPTGIGTVITVVSLLLLAAWNGTAYYPSTADLQSSLTLKNSSSSEFTLRTMAWVSLVIPFVLAYIFYAWRAIDKKKLTKTELAEDEHKY